MGLLNQLVKNGKLLTQASMTQHFLEEVIEIQATHSADTADCEEFTPPLLGHSKIIAEAKRLKMTGCHPSMHSESHIFCRVSRVTRGAANRFQHRIVISNSESRIKVCKTFSPLWTLKVKRTFQWVSKLADLDLYSAVSFVKTLRWCRLYICSQYVQWPNTHMNACVDYHI